MIWLQKEREAFEAWFESRYDANFMQFALDLDMYVDKHTQTSWEAWQAAKAQADAPGQITVTHERLQELIAIGVKAALEAQEQAND